MAKFCTNCGKKLKEGEKCDCTPAVTSNIDFQKILDICKNMFIKPIDTMKEFTKKSNFTLAMILTGALSIIAGLFGMAIMKNAFALIGNQSLYRTYAYGSMPVNIPYGKIFFTSLILVFAISFIYSGVLYLVNTIIFKRTADFKEVYALYGVTSIVISVTMLVSSILMFLNIYFAFIIVGLGSILATVYNYHGLKFLGDKDENKYGYIYLTTCVVFYIVVFIITKIFS
ncbi:MAG: YIP1 family protein [Bacilli bacterium]|nr:YIP1 family protein [Bacilli bacterium]